MANDKIKINIWLFLKHTHDDHDDFHRGGGKRKYSG